MQFLSSKRSIRKKNKKEYIMKNYIQNQKYINYIDFKAPNQKEQNE